MDVRFVRSRGWSADVFHVDIPANVAAGLGLVVPRPGALAKRTQPGTIVLTKGGPAPLSDRIEFEGTLLMAEEDDNGQRWTVQVPNLFVVRAEAVRTSDDSSVARVRLYLADERYFHPWGMMPRWSFNRTRGDGSIAKDSVRPDGTAFPKHEIAQEAARALFRSPPLAAWPEDWEKDTGPVEFPPFAQAMMALGQLAGPAGIEEPSFRLDGAITLHKTGVGMLGYAEGGRGPNTKPFPPEFRLSKDGTGQALVTENTHPEEWIVVVGGERVASVAIDSWEPVLVEGNTVVPLNERTIRKLTRGRLGLEWLNRFVLQPNEVQSVEGVDDVVLELLRDQAYRLWRLPGAVVEAEVSPDVQRFGAAGDVPEDDRARAEAAGGLFAGPNPVVADRPFDANPEPEFVYEPGPNAHLLPLLDRAETNAGRRLPVKVETYRYTTVHQQMIGSVASAKLQGLRAALQKIRDEIIAAFGRSDTRGRDAFIDDPDVIFGDGIAQLSGKLVRLARAEFFGGELQPESRFIDFEELDRAIAEGRRVERIKERVGDAFAAQYEAVLKEIREAQDEVGNTKKYSTLGDLGREAAKFEAGIEKSQGTVLGVPIEGRPDLQARAAKLNGFLKKKLQEAGLLAQDEQDATRTRTRLGGAPPGDPQNVLILRNLPRMEDAGAAVFSAEQGIIRTSGIAGHVEVDPASGVKQKIATNPSHARLLRCPVRVTFGAVVRPRTDSTPGAPRRPLTGPTEDADENEKLLRGDCKAEPDIVPTALTDQESYYTCAFQRQADRTPKQVRLEDVPLKQAVRIGAPFVELVSLEGFSNRGLLDRAARDLVVPRMKIQDQLKTVRTTLGRPWPVQCDGVVQQVEITMRFKDGAPCGFQTHVTSGGAIARTQDQGGTRTDPARRGAAALAAQNAAERREGTRP
ncbi:MAG TPA: hypothetical protein VEA38_16810 [Terriglobales bacterium]|nr:hypothetical protein [Terriglobales bacterium]